MKKILFIAFSLLLSISLTSCSDDNTDIDNDTPEEEVGGSNIEDGEQEEVTDGDILIVYYSRTGYNYPNTWLDIGHTGRMGGYIKDYTGGTIYEIIPTVPYPDDYEETKVISQRETANNERPEIKNPLENLDRYKIIFVGSPIWYGAPPMIMRTFYETYDLSDKTIVPFGTHAGSGISSCTALARQYFPNATFLESFGVSGQDVNGARNSVEAWLQRIGIQKQ